jgi:hypothetical protein
MLKRLEERSKLLYEKTNRMTTTELLIAKIESTRTISFMKSCKLGVVAILGVGVTDISTHLNAGVKLSDLDLVSISSIIFFLLIFLVLEFLQSQEVGRKELMIDLLSLRASRTGLTSSTKKSKTRRN